MSETRAAPAFRRQLALCVLLLAGCASALGTTRDPERDRVTKSEIGALVDRISVLRQRFGFDEEPPRRLLGAPPRSERCEKMAAAGEEICRASARICVLADQLAENEARRACERGREDCRRARAHADACR